MVTHSHASDSAPPSTINKEDMMVSFFCDGGTTIDGFLLAASQELGQEVILNLPYMFSLIGILYTSLVGFIHCANYSH
jgi:hypothetical protein